MATRAPRTSSIDRSEMVKPLDAWWTVLLVDPIATRVIPPLARMGWVTPTRVTLLAHLLGVVCVVLFAVEAMVIAAVVFEIRFVLDCIDGKLARVTGRTSTFGQLLDTFGDRVLFVATAAALGWRLSPMAVLILTTTYVLQFHLVETRQKLLHEMGGSKPIDHILEQGWGQAMARRRMFPFPTSVDVEHLFVFLGPVLWGLGIDLLEPLLWVATTYFALQCARYGISMLRTAATLDRLGSDAVGS